MMGLGAQTFRLGGSAPPPAQPSERHRRQPQMRARRPTAATARLMAVQHEHKRRALDGDYGWVVLSPVLVWCMMPHNRVYDAAQLQRRPLRAGWTTSMASSSAAVLAHRI